MAINPTSPGKKPHSSYIPKESGQEQPNPEPYPVADSSPLSIYFKDIGKEPLLTKEEEVELAAKIKKGNKAARERMIKANLRLVVKIAQDYNHFGLPFLDLISEGNIGLMKAVERFDPQKGGKLSTYAAWWIKQSIKRALTNQRNTIRLPVHLIEKMSRMRRIILKLEETLKREPSNTEIAKEMNLPIAKVAHMRDMAIRPASLDQPIGTDETTSTLGDLVKDEKAESPDEQLEQKAESENIKYLIKKLPKREAAIINMRFGFVEDKKGKKRPQTLEEVGEALNLTRERIRQLQNESLKKLRDLMTESERSRSEEERQEEKTIMERQKVINEFIVEQKNIQSPDDIPPKTIS